MYMYSPPCGGILWVQMGQVVITDGTISMRRLGLWVKSYDEPRFKLYA